MADHVRVGESFGDPYVHPFIDAIPEHPAILQVIKELDDSRPSAASSGTATSPSRRSAAVSILHASCHRSGRHAVRKHGARLDGCRRASSRGSRITATHVYPEKGSVDGSDAPGARIHPRTGRRALHVNPAFVTRIEELEHAESGSSSRSLRPPDPARVPGPSPWETGQVVLWDNRTTVTHERLPRSPSSAPAGHAIEQPG